MGKDSKFRVEQHTVAPQDWVNVSEEILEGVRGSSIHRKIVDLVFITITTVQLRLHLIDYEKALRARSDWMAPAGILFTLVAALVASDFKNFLVNKDIWESIFIILAVLSFIWLVKSLIGVYLFWDKAKLDNLIKKISQESSDQGA